MAASHAVTNWVDSFTRILSAKQQNPLPDVSNQRTLMLIISTWCQSADVKVNNCDVRKFRASANDSVSYLQFSSFYNSCGAFKTYISTWFNIISQQTSMTLSECPDSSRENLGKRIYNFYRNGKTHSLLRCLQFAKIF